MWNEPSPERLNRLPKLYETESVPIKDKLVHLHFFLADCDWWAIEYDGEDIFFGFAVINGDHLNSEWGYFSLSELKDISLGGFMEVDCEPEHLWRVRPASEIKGIKVW